MKTSEILREACAAVEDGRGGLFSAARYIEAADGKKCEAAIRAVLQELEKDGFYKFTPFGLHASVRATILGLAAAIVESERD